VKPILEQLGDVGVALASKRIRSEVWLCDESGSWPQRGTKEQPICATSRDMFDACYDVSLGRKLILHEGEYKTKGWSAHQQFQHADVEMYGQGKSRTVIRHDYDNEDAPLTDYGGEIGRVKRPDGAVFRIGVEHLGISANARIEDLTISTDPGRSMTTVGVRVLGQLIMRNVRVEGVWGCYDQHPVDNLRHEAFSISAVGPNAGSLIEDCEVVYGAEYAYGNGITIGHLPNFTGMPQPKPSKIVRCHVDGIRGNHCGFTASSNTIIESCSSRGTTHGIYQDTAGMRNVSARNCHFEVHWAGFRFHSHNERELYEGFTSDDCTVWFNLLGNNRDCILFATTHTGIPAKFSGFDVRARALNTPGNFYALSTSLPKTHFEYNLRPTPDGLINRPYWDGVPKSMAQECVALRGWNPTPK